MCKEGKGFCEVTLQRNNDRNVQNAHLSLHNGQYFYINCTKRKIYSGKRLPVEPKMRCFPLKLYSTRVGKESPTTVALDWAGIQNILSKNIGRSSGIAQKIETKGDSTVTEPVQERKNIVDAGCTSLIKKESEIDYKDMLKTRLQITFTITMLSNITCACIALRLRTTGQTLQAYIRPLNQALLAAGSEKSSSTISWTNKENQKCN